MHFAEIPGAQAINSVTKVKDGPCGKPKLRRDFNATFFFFARRKLSAHQIEDRQVRDFVSTAAATRAPNAILPPPSKWMREEDEIDRVHEIGKAARRTR